MSQEKKITELLLKADEKLRKQYDTLIRELLNATGEIPKGITTDKLFSIAKNCPPAVKKKIETLLNNYQAQLLNTIQAGITQAVLLSSENAQSVFNGMTNFDEETTAEWRSNVSKAFYEQRMLNMGGLNLSDRVWNYTQQTKAEFELAMSQSIEDAIKKGNSAEQLGRAVREKLNNPDMMYRRYHLKKLMSDGSKKDVVEWRRRVIGKDGKVRFVKEDLAKVGTGVYRSARQNGLRLAMTEINMAYNYANCKRWSSEPFVLGIRIRLSGNHPAYDICDELQGDYPRDFDFTGWHPRCRCSMSPIMMKRDSEEWKKVRALPQAEYENYKSPNAIKGYPKKFKDWCKAYKEKLVDAAKRGKLPYFVRNNKDSVERIIGDKLNTNKTEILTSNKVVKSPNIIHINKNTQTTTQTVLQTKTTKQENGRRVKEPLSEELKARRKEIRKLAIDTLLGKEFKLPNLNAVATISNRGIKEWLNQPFINTKAKNEALLDLQNLIEKSVYRGSGVDKHFQEVTLHLFETSISDCKCWIIVRQNNTGEYLIYSVSDNESILRAIK